jgi:hypothetical protein
LRGSEDSRPRGLPHSDIPGSRPVCGSPGLIAAYHVLRRLLVPRHPPCAFSRLISKSSSCFSAGFLHTTSPDFDCQRAAHRRRTAAASGLAQMSETRGTRWATLEAFRPPLLWRSTRRSRKEVIQPQVPLRLPCYDFAPVTELTLNGCVLAVRPPASGPSSFHGVTGGVYKARERIHRGVADPRLLAIPTSRSRVADSDPHLDRLLAIGSPSRVCDALYRPL